MQAGEVVTNLIGRHASWFGDRGKEGGTIMAVAYDARAFVLLVLTDRGLQHKHASGVYIE